MSKKQKISVLIHAYNEAENIVDCIGSIKDFADEIVVVDNYSEDKTRELAKNEGARVFLHPYSGHVETSRNFGVKKVRGDWVLVLDADERASKNLKEELKKIINKKDIDIVLIPRKNIIFDKWIKYTGWWPDHQMRFFRKGSVSWSGDIDVVIAHSNRKLVLTPKEKYALIHYNYANLREFIERLNKYTDFYAKRLIKEKSKISLYSPIRQAINEFVNRFIISRGYKDGYTGLVLSILMGFYFFSAYAKALELQKKLDNQNNALRISQKIILLGSIKLIFWEFFGIYILEFLRFVKNKFKQICLKLKLQ